MDKSEYVAFGIYEGQGLVDEINIVKTDGMAKSTISEDDGYFVITHNGDIEDENETTQLIKIHPANFYDFVELINEAALLHGDRKCHWDDSLCYNQFLCNSCDNNPKGVQQ